MVAGLAPRRRTVQRIWSRLAARFRPLPAGQTEDIVIRPIAFGITPARHWIARDGALSAPGDGIEGAPAGTARTAGKARTGAITSCSSVGRHTINKLAPTIQPTFEAILKTTFEEPIHHQPFIR